MDHVEITRNLKLRTRVTVETAGFIGRTVTLKVTGHEVVITNGPEMVTVRIGGEAEEFLAEEGWTSTDVANAILEHISMI